MKRVTFFAIATPLLTAFLFSFAVAGDLVVGTLFDHSGALKDWGQRHQRAAELAARHLAAAGLSIDFIHADSQTSAEAAIKAARVMVDEKKVGVILGSASSGVIIPLAENVTCPSNVLLISPGATSAFITDLPQDKGKDLVFRTCPSDNLQGIVLGKLAAARYKTASVMYVNNPYGQGLAQQFSRAFSKHGGFVYTMIPHDEKVAATYADDLRNAFARMYSTPPYRSGSSAVLCVFSYPEHAKVYVKEAVDLYGNHQFLFSDGSKSEELAAAVGAKYLEGAMGTAPAIAPGEAFQKLSVDYSAAFGELPNSPFIANAYDAAALIGLAAYAAKVKGQPLTAEAIRGQLRQVANPPGAFVGPGDFAAAFKLLADGQDINYEVASGTVDFNDYGDVSAPIEIWRFKNGKIVTYRMEYQVDDD